MPKLDKQNRIIVPTSLLKELNWVLPKEIAVCYNFENKYITICDKQKINGKYVIRFSPLDKKGRFSLPKEAVDLLGINNDAFIIIYLINNELCIKGMDRTRT